MQDADWLYHYLHYLGRFANRKITPIEIAAAIHHAFKIADVEKYATAKSRFSFGLTGATDEDVAEIRSYLSEFENSIVEIKRKVDFQD